MVITFVMDQFGETSNGTACTAMRFADVLRREGHEVRILTASHAEGSGVYTLPEWKIPVFQYIIDRNGIKFARPDEKIISEAIEGSDVVHMFMPFKLQRAALEVAQRMHVATTAAFHVQPENITYNIKLNNFEALNVLLYRRFKRFFDRFSHVHCPSEMLRKLLDGYKYRSNKHVISNGILPDFKRNDEAERPEKWKDRYVIVMSGRFAREKRQDVLIKAVAKSRYADKIQLVLCGKGHIQGKLQRLSDRLLPNPVQIKFCTKNELIDILSCADLYVHASEVELEAISCMEAFACGLVPVIADAEMSATKQFALTERNLFSSGDADDLARHIDWFIEHPDEKAELAARYAEYAHEFELENCVKKLLEVFEVAVEENARKWENTRKEDEYVGGLNGADRRKYNSSKKKYVRGIRKQGSDDWMNSYIETVLK